MTLGYFLEPLGVGLEGWACYLMGHVEDYFSSWP
jgi:hypothetical protein